MNKEFKSRRSSAISNDHEIYPLSDKENLSLLKSAEKPGKLYKYLP